MRSLVYFLLTGLLVGVYGGRVCPVIEAASALTWGTFLLGCFLAVWVLHRLLAAWFVRGAAGDRQPMRELVLDFGLFLAAGLAICAFVVRVLGSPVPNGIKVLCGVLAVGFFLSLDLALRREHENALDARVMGEDVPDGRYFPITLKFAMVSGACVVFTALVIAGMIVKNIHEHPELPGTDFWAQAMYWVALDLGFAIVCLTGLAMLVITSFARNLRLLFSFQTESLDAVTRGDLTARVPVVSHDEFGRIASHTNVMIRNLEERTAALERTQDATIVTLAGLAETRDNETGAHILRTQRYVRALAEYMRRLPAYAARLEPEVVELLYKSAPLHDVGKVGVPDAILLKPGRHTPEEFEIMKKHTVYGRDALRSAEDMLGSDSFLRLAQEIAYTHHEKWDGSGYPRGLAGEAIPLSGRLMALADVYDALISKRVYKPAFSHEKARGIIVEGRGGHFDPAVVDAFVAIEAEFVAIAAALRDSETHGEDDRPGVAAKEGD